MRHLICTLALSLLFFVFPARGNVLVWSIYENTPDPTTTDSIIARGAASQMPNRRLLITDTFATPAIPSNSYAEFYSSHLRGFIEAPETGEYFFYFRQDDKGALHLSTDENPANMQKIYDRHAVLNYQENDVSLPVQLVKGKRYYFEFVHVEIGGGDFFGLGWRRPSGVVEKAISMRHILPLPIDPNTYQPFTTAPKIIGPQYHPNGANENAYSGQPKNLTVQKGNPAVFSVGVEVSLPAVFQWRRNGQPIPGANLVHYEIPNVTTLDDGALFDVVISNAFGAVTSEPATLTVQGGTFTLLTAKTFGNPNGVDLIFSDALKVDTLIPANFAVSNETARITVSEVVKVAPNRVRLVAPFPGNELYSVTVDNVADAAGAVLARSSKTFLQSEGWVDRRIFTGIGGNEVAALTNSAAFKSGTPDLVQFSSHVRIINQGNLAENYGVQIRGYLSPNTTGPHIFSVASDDQAQVAISTDDNPANLLIVGLSPQANLPPIPSAPISLTAGRKYYFEFLMKEGTGGDFLFLAVSPPGTTPPTDLNRPSMGPEMNITRFGYRQGNVQFTTQPTEQNTSLGGSVQFTAAVDGTLPHFYQWYKNGEPIPGAFDATYKIDATVPSDNNALFHVVAGNHFSSVASTPVKLSVTGAEPPLLTIERVGEEVVVTWSAEAIGYQLEATTELKTPSDQTPWEFVDGSDLVNTIRFPASAAPKYFRLKN